MLKQGQVWSPVGDFTASFIQDGQIAHLEKGMMASRLNLKADGTFEMHFEVHFMSDIVEDATGSYTFREGHIFLKGKATGYSSDGHGRENVPPSYGLNLTIVGRQLVQGDSPDNAIIYTLTGDKPTVPLGFGPLPVIKDPSALECLKKTVAFYHGLKSYSDSGILSKVHPLHAIETSKLTTYFLAPKKMRFSIQMIESGKQVASAERWEEGAKVRYFNSLDDYQGVTTDPKLTGDIYTISQQFGYGLHTVPNLLSGGQFPIGAARQIVTTSDERIGTAKCQVVRIAYSKENSVTLWIDRGSHLIRKIQSGAVTDGDTITLFPKANPVITPKDLTPGKPGHYY